MTTNKHDFEELAAPKAAAKELGISVATLRKYSLIVERVTGKADYFARTKQKARLYHQKDIDDLKAFHRLSKNSGLTLQEAARQIYAVSEKDETPVAKTKTEYTPQDVMDTQQVVKLLNTLQKTISNQNEAISSLQKQLNVIQKQNEDLIKAQKQLAAPKDNTDKIEALPDISEIVPDDKKPKDPEEKREEVKEDMHKSQAEMHDKIISKAKENAKKRATANVHRTLEDMQLPEQKEHWWQRIFKF
ncbi:MerR family transcriptional regulator [Lactobacillus kefiranofaciens]|uniref:MerR family transcriptional regulator n=1 Tax=Lactobacillus kefiranofaciens TaxID=267818 RepID=UPI0024682B40|nr:MerR family transcriptional regulator [Lactobacillus kefiranofaciens]MDH5100836.1 MerR family transcriptional regulator [Lactobacillus kefiranofaciens]